LLVTPICTRAFKATEVLIEDRASGRVTRWQPSAINSWIGWVSMIAVWAFSRMVLSVAMLLRARPRSLPAATVTVGWSTTLLNRPTPSRPTSITPSARSE
jgi:hypothetical protein